MAAMAEERLTEISTIWTTSAAPTRQARKSQAAMEELVGRYHDAVDTLHPPEGPRSASRPTKSCRSSGPSC